MKRDRVMEVMRLLAYAAGHEGLVDAAINEQTTVGDFLLLFDRPHAVLEKFANLVEKDVDLDDKIVDL